jgi:predicted DNA-binding ribbon-helix-helix protein
MTPPTALPSLARALADVMASAESDGFARIEKRSVTVSGHPTSLSLEGGFWTCLKLIADHRGLSLAGLIAEVDSNREGNLSSALRVHVLREALSALARAPTGHEDASSEQPQPAGISPPDPQSEP